MSCSVRKIATLAGVSVGTVSRVINGATNVDAAIQEKTIAAMRALNYVPQRKITSTKTVAVKTWNIGLVLWGTTETLCDNRFIANAIKNIERYCRLAGYHLVVEMIDPAAPSLPQCILGGNVDGVLCPDLDHLGNQLFAIAAAVPVVGLFNYQPLLPVPQICNDDYGSGTLAIKETYARGHRRIAFINYKPDHHGFRIRQQAYIDFMEKNGCFRPDYLLVKQLVSDLRLCNVTPPDMNGFAARLSTLEPSPTAILVANDWGAAGLYPALKRHGLIPGQDISVVGFDNDFDQASVLLEPPLSTVDIPFRQIAEAATAQLLRWIETGSRDVCTQMFPGTFISRPSLFQVETGETTISGISTKES